MKNKFTFQFLLLLISVFSLSYSYADPVDSLRALNYAKQFYGANNTAMKNGRMADFEFMIETKIPYNASAAKNGRVASTNEFLYYVFNVGENKGFVIISGDDAALPVLGYSTTGHYDSKNLNPALQMWMKGYEEQLKYIKENNLKSTTEIQQKWENVNSDKNARVAAVAPLIQTSWGQGDYVNGYNDLCPMDGTVRSITGCVATALAQVLNFWSQRGYTINGYGEGSYRQMVNNTFYQYDGFLIANNYEWNNMPNNLINASLIQKQAISKLMYNCGLSVNMHYQKKTNGGSLALPSEILIALKDHFNFNVPMLLYKQEFTNYDWEQMIKSELDNLRPIIYGGYTDNNQTEGHSFICDGYDNNTGLFHFNWGWDGRGDDIFFQISNLTPEPIAPKTLSFKQIMTLGISPRNSINNCPLSFQNRKANNFTGDPWFKGYAEKATSLGLVESSNASFNPAKVITIGDAARSVVLAARRLNISPFTLIDNEPCSPSNPNGAFVEILRRNGYLSNTDAGNAQSNIKLGLLCKMVSEVIFGAGFPQKQRPANTTKVLVKTDAYEKANIVALAAIKGIKDKSFKKFVEYTLSGLKDQPITGNESVTNDVLAKVISNAYNFRLVSLGIKPTTGTNNRTETASDLDDPNDWTEVGDKYENTSTPYGSQVPQYTLNSINMLSGQTRTFSFPDVTIGGLPVHVYWAVDGVLSGSQLVPVSNTFQSVTFTAPTVTTARTIQLYYYAATSGGYAAEFFQDIVVSPAVTSSGAISISPSPSNFNFGSVTVGQTTPQTFTIQNTSAQNVTIDNYVLSGSGFVPLAGTTCCSVTLAPNQTTSIAVGFTPGQAGSAQGTLEINGGFTGSPTRIVLSGAGLANTAPTITSIPALGSSVTFIDTKVGNYEDKIFTISNNSQSNFIGSFSVSGSAYSAFILNESGTALNIPAGGIKYVYVRFSPTDNETFTGSFVITGNASNTPSTFSLTGLGYGGPNYGCVSVNTRLITKTVNIAQPGTTEFGRFMLTNTSSTKSASIINFKLVGWDKTRFTISPNYVNSTFTLGAGQSQEFIVYLTNISTQANYDGGISIQGDGCDYTDVTFRGIPGTSNVNVPELYAPANNFVMSQVGGYYGSFILQIKKKNTGDLAKYLLYLYDETAGQVLYNFVDYGTFGSIGTDQFFTIRNTSSENIYAQVGHRYSWKVRAVNTANADDYKDSPIWYFTVEQPPICLAPSSYTLSSITSTTAKVDLIGNNVAVRYRVEVSSDGGQNWTLTNSMTETSGIIQLLAPNKTYQVRLQSYCAMVTTPINQFTRSGYTTVQNFTTQALCQATVSSSSTQNICFGQTATLTASSGNSYQWYKDDVLIQGATSRAYQVAVSGSYSVKVSQNDGCVSTSAKTTVNVIYTNTQVNVSGSTQICGSNSVVLNSPTTGLTYQWLKDNVSISGATNSSYTTSQTGNYSLKIINQGCVVNSQSIDITPLVVSAPSIDPQTINSGQTATLTASNCPGSVKWYTAATGGTLLSTGNPYTTSALTASIAYYASCVVNNCESTTRGSGIVTINGGCTPPAAPILPQMGSFTYQQFTLQASGCSGTVKWFVDATTTTPVYTGNPYVTPIIFATKTYYATCTVGSCESVRTSTTLNITPCPATVVHGTGTLVPNLYQGQIISSQRNVSNLTYYRAANSIILNAGFQAGSNELFTAEIGACATMPEDGLLAYYPFNNGSMSDESGKANHAANNGATLSTDRKNATASAYYFNGTNAWMNTPMVQSNLTGYTISAWVKPEFTANQEYVILQNRGTSPGSGRSLTLHYQVSTGRWCFAIDGDNLYTGVQAPSANTTSWVHVVGVWSSGGADTFNANQFKVYVNGIVLSAIAINGNSAAIPGAGLGTVAIGRHEAWGSYFKGTLDDIRIYNRALTDQEVQSIYVIER